MTPDEIAAAIISEYHSEPYTPTWLAQRIAAALTAERKERESWQAAALEIEQKLEGARFKLAAEREAREKAEAEVERLREWEHHTVDEGMRGASRYWENRWRDEAAAREKAEAALSAISSVIGRRVGCEFMDPPDGGDVSLAEQVSRLIDAREKAEAERDAIKASADGALQVQRERHTRLVAEARNAALRDAAELARQFYEVKGSRIADAILALIKEPSHD